MKALYDADIDLLEVMQEGQRSIGKQATDALTIFYAERSKEIVGFSLEAAASHLGDLALVPVELRLSAIFRLVRGMLDLTQEQFAAKLDVSVKTISRIETGTENNPTLDNLIGVTDMAPEGVDVSVLLRKQRQANARAI